MASISRITILFSSVALYLASGCVSAHAEDYKTSFTLVEQKNDLGERTACGLDFLVYSDYQGVQGRLIVNRFYRLQFDFGAGVVDNFGEFNAIPIKTGVLTPAGFGADEKLPLTFSWDAGKQAPIYDQPRNKEWRPEMIQAMLYSGFRLSYNSVENPNTPVEYSVEGDFEVGRKFNDCQSEMFKNVQDQYKSKHGSTECLDNPDACLKKQ